MNLTNQTNCAERSASTSNPETMDDLSSDDTETPLILPDLSPTREDLNNVEREDTVKTMDSDGIENNVEPSLMTKMQAKKIPVIMIQKRMTEKKLVIRLR